MHLKKKQERGKNELNFPLFWAPIALFSTMDREEDEGNVVEKDIQQSLTLGTRILDSCTRLVKYHYHNEKMQEYIESEVFLSLVEAMEIVKTTVKEHKGDLLYLLTSVKLTHTVCGDLLKFMRGLEHEEISKAHSYHVGALIDYSGILGACFILDINYRRLTEFIKNAEDSKIEELVEAVRTSMEKK
jgi:hypothetical protein